MFHQAQIKLTLFYSVLFLLLFWVFSFGIYLWMERSFGEGYINQVKQRQQHGQNIGEFDDRNAIVVTIAGDVALNQLRNILLVLNGGLLIVIPITSWFLAKRTLSPVYKIHEQQKQFVSDASHEMRTPLSIMSGEIEVALNKRRIAEDYKSTLISTKEEIDRLTALVENLLFLAREDQSKTNMRLTEVDITDVVNNTLAGFTPQMTKKDIVTTFEPLKESMTIRGYESMLRQLFYNLIENAIKYTPKKGKISIYFTQKKEYVAIHVKDTGLGIDKEEQARIYDRFYRADTSRSETKGYGLGLAICKAVVDRHKGRLLVNSDIGRGTTFTVELPYE